MGASASNSIMRKKLSSCFFQVWSIVYSWQSSIFPLVFVPSFLLSLPLPAILHICYCLFTGGTGFSPPCDFWVASLANWHNGTRSQMRNGDGFKDFQGVTDLFSGLCFQCPLYSCHEWCRWCVAVGWSGVEMVQVRIHCHANAYHYIQAQHVTVLRSRARRGGVPLLWCLECSAEGSPIHMHHSIGFASYHSKLI